MIASHHKDQQNNGSSSVDNHLEYAQVGYFNREKLYENQLQEFRYFVVIDFEATCDEARALYPQEIIEFPSVIVNGLTGQLEACFRTYVRPACNPNLSDYCKNLTGIQQIQMDQLERYFPTDFWWWSLLEGGSRDVWADVARAAPLRPRRCYKHSPPTLSPHAQGLQTPNHQRARKSVTQQLRGVATSAPSDIPVSPLLFLWGEEQARAGS